MISFPRFIYKGSLIVGLEKVARVSIRNPIRVKRFPFQERSARDGYCVSSSSTRRFSIPSSRRFDITLVRFNKSYVETTPA